MGDIRKRIERIEAQLRSDRDQLTEEDDCAACAWYADALETLDSGEELAPADQAIWDDIFINRTDGTRAWKNGQLQKTN